MLSFLSKILLLPDKKKSFIRSPLLWNSWVSPINKILDLHVYSKSMVWFLWSNSSFSLFKENNIVFISCKEVNPHCVVIRVFYLDSVSVSLIVSLNCIYIRLMGSFTGQICFSWILNLYRIVVSFSVAFTSFHSII